MLGIQQCVRCCGCNLINPHHNPGAVDHFCPYFSLRNFESERGKQLARGHAANRWQSSDSKPGESNARALWSLDPVVLCSFCHQIFIEGYCGPGTILGSGDSTVNNKEESPDLQSLYPREERQEKCKLKKKSRSFHMLVNTIRTIDGVKR